MKKIITLLLLLILSMACYGQNNVMDYPTKAAPELDDWIYLINGGTTDAKTSKLQFQQNLFDSLGVVRAVIALQQIDIDNNTDSIVSNEVRIANNSDSIISNEARIENNTDSIVSNEARVEANESQITTNGVNISGNSIAIGDLESDVSDLEDSTLVHRNELNNATDSITFHRTLLDSLFDQVALLWDTIEYYHPPPEDYEYADADSLTMLMEWDLSVYSVGREPLKSVVVAGLPHGGAEDSDTLAGFYVDNMGFDEIDSEIVLVSYYDSLQCCVEFLDDNVDGYGRRGAGIHTRLNANSGSTDMRNGFRGFTFWLGDNLSMTESLKFAGMHRKAVGGNDQRDYLSTLEESTTPGRFWLKTYDWSFDDGPGDVSMDDVHQHYLTDGMTDTVIFLSGQWYTYFEAWDCGTIDGADAWKAIAIDGVWVMRHSGLTWNTTADNLRYPNSNNMEFHMGGNSSVNFNSLSDGEIWFRNIYNGQFDAGYSEFPDPTVMPDLDEDIKLPIESGFMIEFSDPE